MHAIDELDMHAIDCQLDIKHASLRGMYKKNVSHSLSRCVRMHKAYHR